jgi:TolB protein
MKNKNWFGIIAALTMGFAGSACAQKSIIDIIGYGGPGNTPPIWISMTGFSGEAAEVLQRDLYVQGFGFTNAEAAQYVITGKNNGNLEGRATDRISKATLVSKAYSGASVRRQAHAFADDFVASLNRKGIAQTKIAFKVDTGGSSEIYISDFDGGSPQAVTTDKTIVAAPCWAPGRFALYYTTYKLGNPDIFYHDLSSGQRRGFSRYSGLNTSAAVSADGKRVAMILSKGGSPDVYVCDADGSNLKRLTATREDESSPCWSPDGEWICFATRINERRSLCKVPAAGGPVQRISTVGISSPTEPDWSPDGNWIAFTRQMGANNFEICVVRAAGGEVTELVAGEDPSWSANSRTLVYARREGGRRVLSLLDVPTKQYKDVSRISGSNSQPSWAK